MTTIEYITDASGIVTLTIDVPDRPLNVLTPAFLADLTQAVDRIATDPAAIGAVLTSGKTSGFLAGADLKEMLALHDSGITAPEAARWAMDAAAVLRRLETCGKPVVAAINGLALGGGYEVALACHRRMALDTPAVRLGLPEVTLGLLPGGGGTQRLPRMIGVEAALPLLLDGRILSVAEALRAGLVDEVAADPAALMEAARGWLLSRPSAIAPWDTKGYRLPGGTGPLAPHAAQSFMAGTSRLKATRRCYPAPHAILSAVYEGTQVPFETGMRIEAKYFGTLLADKVSGNLMRSFLRTSAARKRSFGDPARQPLAVQRIGVLGAGMMGSGIAQVAVGAGIDVVLYDTDPSATARAVAGAENGRPRAQGSLTSAGTLTARITPADDVAALSGAQLIVEAVFEDGAVKRDILGKAQPMLAPSGFIASNTSTLAITGLARAIADPARFIGLHFFSPVARMPLVEVIVGAETAEETIADALAFVAKLKKTPIIVHDSPGFYTSRVFCTYIDEAMAMLAEGVSPALIENAARMAGFPAPPLAVTDEVSLDLQARVIGQAKADGLDRRFLRDHAAPVVARLNALGRLGRKAGAGFYDYAAEGGKQLWPGLTELFPQAARQPTAEEVGKRLLYIQALESARCLAEGVIDDEVTADIGSVLGIGYPAWTGGALSLISTVGPERFAAECAGFARSCGERFSPEDVVIARAVAAASRSRAA
ncbi:MULTISPECIES: 3-hydroxyacyl-CoA dehydrogenase NAD-binding domain-containing protein [unclassified Haematobacter]|uniref:3-hydroxyacyl-CoA dehydrogenase NAD-binding domain-containing protein n=1 Tax=unclassified Haematobacter TaxID=2640585 RepID=UPI0025B8A650|nr:MULTISPECIES: 3-hydroxyacyl-CoA dehydrogenase NAD-binding domain-containing protein [unclassified Haematobacter]